MLSNLEMLGQSFSGFANFHTLIYVLGATLLGIIIGALPGLTATMGVALMTTLTYSMDNNSAILVLICTYVGAIYGGIRADIRNAIERAAAAEARADKAHQRIDTLLLERKAA